MDSKTVLAVVLSVVVITVGFLVQNMLFPPEQPAPQVSSTQEPVPGSEGQSASAGQSGQTSTETGTSQSGSPAESSGSQGAAVTGQPAGPTAPGTVVPVQESGISTRTHVYQNDTVKVTFDPAGGSVSSFELLKHKGKNGPVEMIQNADTGRNAFTVAFGGPNASAENVLYHYKDSTDPNVIEFYRQFYLAGQPGRPFTVHKKYTFKPQEYLFQLDVTIENSVNEYLPLNFDGTAYTLKFGPQIGPAFTELDGRNEYRHFYTYQEGKRHSVNPGRENEKTVSERVAWAAIAGKYFTAIGVPDATDYAITFSDKQVPGINTASQMFFSRPVIKSSRNTDVYRFYIGPKINRTLARYDNANDNAFGVRNLDLEATVDSRFLLGWLENILKFILQTIYHVVPNYGIAIIILTFIVKIIMWPLTHKSYESTARMQEMNPKIQELRDKYKDNPQKMNAEMAAMYKREGVNPLGGCLPMLLQLPFFIAMFGLFNNHFDLRGAAFIQGWINDLSSPESIIHFNNFTIPILGWTDIRLLPIIFVATQIITSKFTQTPASGGSASQMKMMTYMLPIVFFFILYNMPSGLLVYWIVTNVLTAGQQYYNKRLMHNRAVAAGKA